MALDSVGNPRVDFAWGNFPMQPDDQRGAPLGGRYQIVSVQNAGDRGQVMLRGADATKVKVGMIVSLTGLADTVDTYGNPLALSKLNRNFEVYNVSHNPSGYSGFPETYVMFTESFEQVVGAYVYITPPWASPAIPAQLTTARLVAGAGNIIGGGAGDTGWSQTTPVNSAITNSANNPFENIQENGWSGYPGYFPNDIDAVPGSTPVPNFVGADSFTTNFIDDVIAAGFTVGSITNDKHGWVGTYQLGTRYLNLYNQNSTTARLQMYAPQTFTGTIQSGTVVDVSFISTNMGNYSNLLTQYPDMFAFISSHEWVVAEGSTVSGNGWFDLTTPGQVTGQTWGGWTDNYDVNGQSIGIGSLTTTDNSHLVKHQSPAAGKTAAAGSAIHFTVYGDVASGQFNQLQFEVPANVGDSRRLYFVMQNNNYLPIINSGDSITFSGIKQAFVAYGVSPNTTKKYIDLTQLNKAHTVTGLDINTGRVYVDTVIAELAEVAQDTYVSMNAYLNSETLWERN